MAMVGFFECLSQGTLTLVFIISNRLAKCPIIKVGALINLYSHEPSMMRIC
jgi:hypothetical protein